MRRILLTLCLTFAATPVGAQRLDIRADGEARDTVYLMPGDTIPLRVMGKTARNGTVTPKDLAYGQTAHCLEVLDDGDAHARIVERICGMLPGWVRAAGTVSGVLVEDSIYVTRPSFALGSELGLCLTWSPGALYYRARDTTVALAIQGADRRIAANFVPDSAAPQWHWQGARLQVQYAAIACMPGYRARDVTRLAATRWTTADTSIATVDRYGLATWKTQRAAMVLSVEWPVR